MKTEAENLGIPENLGRKETRNIWEREKEKGEREVAKGGLGFELTPFCDLQVVGKIHKNAGSMY